jgi:hypothetical protein
VEFLDFLTHLPVRRPGKQQALAVVTADVGGPGRRRAGSSINRTMAAVSSFYEFVIAVEAYDGENPVRKVDDVASGRVRRWGYGSRTMSSTADAGSTYATATITREACGRSLAPTGWLTCTIRPHSRRYRAT